MKKKCCQIGLTVDGSMGNIANTALVVPKSTVQPKVGYGGGFIRGDPASALTSFRFYSTVRSLLVGRSLSSSLLKTGISVLLPCMMYVGPPCL